MTHLPSSFNIPHLHIIVIFCHFFGGFSSLPHNLGQHNFLSPDATKSQLCRLEFFCFCVDRKHEIQSGICNKSVLTLCCNLYMLFAFYFSERIGSGSANLFWLHNNYSIDFSFVHYIITFIFLIDLKWKKERFMNSTVVNFTKE